MELSKIDFFKLRWWEFEILVIYLFIELINFLILVILIEILFFGFSKIGGFFVMFMFFGVFV